MTPLEKLNYVLEKTHHQRDYFHIQEDLCNDNNLSVDKHNLNMILNKLQKDGYVDFIAGERYVTGQQAGEGITIRRNFDGDLFLSSGGYIKQAATIESSERIKNNREIHLVRGTWAVAIGAIALVLWEMYKTFCLEK